MLLNCGVGEDSWEPLDCKDIQLVHPKGNQSWIVIGRTDAETEIPVLWPPDAKNWLIWKTLMLGKIEGRRRRGWQRMRLLGGINDVIDMSLNKLREMVKDREAWHAAVYRVTKNWTWLTDWTTTSSKKVCLQHRRYMRHEFLFLGRENSLEEKMATHSHILAWKNPMHRA